MPPVIAAIGVFLSTVVFGATVATWITVGSLVASGVGLVRSLLTRQPEQEGLAQLAGPKRTIRSEVAPERYVVGRARVPGLLAYYGAYQRNAVMGLVLSEGECEEIEKVWVDGHEVLLERISEATGDKLKPAAGSRYRGKIEFFEYFQADGTQGAFLRGIQANAAIDTGPQLPTTGNNYYGGFRPGDPDAVDGSLIGGDPNTYWRDFSDGGPIHETEFYLHSPMDINQPVEVHPYRTTFPDWSAAHKLNGKSWVAVHLIQPEYGQDIERRFWTHIPNLEFLVKGKKITWPGQAAKIWTENAAAIRYWWETERRGRAADQIDTTDFQAAYSLCDESVTVVLPAVYSEFEPTSKRYSVNGVISSGDSVPAVEDQLNLAWAGEVLESRGVLYFRPGVQDQNACASIQEADVVESPRVQPWAPIQERVNAVTAEIGQSKAHQYSRLSLPEFVDAAAETRDGEKRSGRMVLAFVNDPIAAGRLQAVNLRRARESLRMVVAIRPGSDPQSSDPDLHFDRLGLLPTDCILVTNTEFGFDDFRMVVERVRIRTDWSVELTLREDLADTYDDSLVSASDRASDYPDR